MMRTADYYRMSTDQQETSIPQQMADTRKMCAEDGDHIVATYKDEGLSGGENNRPALQRLIAEARTLRLEAVACYALDRLSRSDAMAAIGEIFYPLKQAGVRWIKTTKERIDLDNVVGQTLLGLQQNFTCHQEKVSIADRTSRGRIALWLEGYWISNKPPYGYKIVQRRDSKMLGPGRGAGKLAIVEEEATLVRRCFELYEQLRSSRLVALAMGKSQNWVKDKLNRAVYCGRRMEPRRSRGKHFRYSNGGRVSGAARRRFRSKAESQGVDGVYPAIVTPAQFDRVQELLRASCLRGKAGGELRLKRRDCLLSQRLFCGDCKRMMYGKKYPSHSYRCSGHVLGIGCADSKIVDEAELLQLVIPQVRADFEAKGGIQAVRKELMDYLETAVTENDNERAEEKRRLAGMEEEIAQARKGLLRLQAASEEIYKEAVADVEKMMRERDGLARQLTVQHQENEFRLAYARAVEATLAGLGSAALTEKLLELVERIDLRFERVPRDRKRWMYRLAGGLIQYKTIQGFPKLAAFQAKPIQGKDESATLIMPAL